MATILITGGHSGIGLECSKRLAATTKHTLLLAGRDMDRIEAAARQLRSQGATVKTLQLDVASLASVRTGAAHCRAMLDRGELEGIEAILCNAGAQFMGPILYSPDGFQTKKGKFSQRRSSEKSYDTAAAAKLWADSESLVHLKPEERSALLAA